MARAIQAQVPDLELCFIREIGVDSAGASTGDEKGLAGARRPSKDRCARNLPKVHHAEMGCRGRIGEYEWKPSRWVVLVELG